MPAKYEKIKESLKRQGKSDKTAKRIAAATYNKQRKPGQAPVTRNYEKTVARRRSRSRS